MVSAQIAGIILAAGKGTRMNSTIPKVLHKLGNSTLLEWVIKAMDKTYISDTCVVVGGDIAPFESLLSAYPSSRICIQNQRRGTGDAVAAASLAFKSVKPPSFNDSALLKGEKISADYCLICAGDTPLIPSDILNQFIESTVTSGAPLGVIGMEHPEPTGYGRLVLDELGNLERIVEEKDASDEIKKINLCNTGIVLAKTDVLFDLLDKLTLQNAQAEYYLTDCFELAKENSQKTFVFKSPDYNTFQGINTQQQLQDVEQWLNNNQ